MKLRVDNDCCTRTVQWVQIPPPIPSRLWEWCKETYSATQAIVIISLSWNMYEMKTKSDKMVIATFIQNSHNWNNSIFEWYTGLDIYKQSINNKGSIKKC